jgi:hypothetical protein
VDGQARLICSTNAIESLNARYRRAVRARGHFPTEQAAMKCLYLVTRSLDPTGTGRARWMMRWNPVINAFAITFGDAGREPRPTEDDAGNTDHETDPRSDQDRLKRFGNPQVCMTRPAACRSCRSSGHSAARCEERRRRGICR